MKYFFNFSFIIINLYLISIYKSCSSTGKSASSQNLSNIYKSSQEFIHPKYAVFHRTNTVSELHFKINSKELLYSKQAGNENFMARISIRYRLISSYETKDIIDSATVLLSDPFSSSPKDILGKIDFNATFTNTYLLDIEFTDLNRNVTAKSFMSIDKLDHSTRQNFLLISPETNTPLFRDNVSKTEHFSIRYRSPGIKLSVRYYHREFSLPAPPFSTSNIFCLD